jgi:PAS domain S-box-containing protein
MEERLARLIRFHDVVSEVGRTIVSEHGRQRLFDETCRILVEEGRFQAAWIGVSDPTNMDIRFVAAHGGNDSFRNEFRVTVDDLASNNEVVGTALLQEKCFCSNDIVKDSRVIPWRSEAVALGYQSSAAFPLTFGERIIGVLIVWSSEADIFGNEEVAVFERLVALLSTALTLSKREEQRKHAEEELRESEARYRRLAENVLELVSQIDVRHVFQYVSPSHKRLLGYEPEDLLGKPFFDMIHPDDLKTARAALQSVLNNGSTARMEVRFRRANGQYLLLEVVGDVLYNERDEVAGFILGSRNITERRQAEDKLRRYAEHLEEMVRERTERIRKLNETITQRLIQKINQINHISELRENLKSSPGISQSFQTILDNSTRDLAMSDAAILTVNSESRIVEVRAIKTTRPVDVKKTYSLDAPFMEYDCINRNCATSRVILKEPSILGTKSLHCSPVSSRNQVSGILALGSDKELILDESDLSVLKLYSGLVSTVLETASLTVEPMKETMKRGKSKYTLEFGRNYLVADNVDLAYDVFTDTIMSGIEGLCVTRTLPDKLRKKYGLKKTPIIWLTSEVVKNERTINSLQDISILISNYVEKVEKPVILIDGIEYLASHQGFESVYHFLQAKRTQVETAGGILIVPFFQGALDQKEVKLLQREFEAFTES